jgi:DNA-binding MarR family transcriptional regulator
VHPLNENPPTDPLVHALMLIDRFSMGLTRIAHETLGPSGVTSRDIRVLLTIYRLPGLTPSDLADRLAIARALVSQSLHRFRKAQLVKSDVDPADHRSWRVSVTANGRTQVEIFEAQVAEWFAYGEPQIRSIFALFNRTPDSEPGGFVTSLEAVSTVAAAGGPWVAEVTSHLLPYRVLTATDRYALSLVDALGSLRPRELSTALHLTTSGVSALLDRMGDAGLTARTHQSGERDRKAVRVALTPHGTQAARFRREALSHHSDQVLAAFAQTLRVRVETEGLARLEPDRTQTHVLDAP